MYSAKVEIAFGAKQHFKELVSPRLNYHFNGRSYVNLIPKIGLLLLSLCFIGFSSGLYAEKLNDTGVVGCANNVTNNLTCPQADFPNQDAQQGRDITHNDDSDGHAGFSYTKLDSNGNALAADSLTWSCVRDNVTNLIWEVKSSEVWDLQDNSWGYSWYNSSGTNDGGLAGTQHEDGECVNDNYLNCNTEDYVTQVNVQTLCGHADWRLPSRNDLISLLRYDQADEFINSDYFPNFKANQYSQYSRYWSATTTAQDSQDAWMVDYSSGATVESPKYYSGHIRLVRSGE